MEVKELMIGDCVRVPSELNRVMRVRSTFDMDYAPLYRPIPLTSEILKKNGFENISKELFVYYSSAADGYIKIRLSDLLDGEWELSVDNYDKFNDSHKQYTSDRCFLKVHELQHALRLCGIKKEIVL